MITSQLEFTSQKYRKKRTEALKNIAVLQQKLKKPVRIFSEKNRSKQKNSKKKGFSVEWVYQPETKLLDYAHSLSSIRNSKMSKIYVRITIYDETHKEKYNDNKKPHLIPMEALEQYFCVADAIRADRLFELYEDIPPKLWDKGDVLE